jgi:hypothetical protein
MGVFKKRQEALSSVTSDSAGDEKSVDMSVVQI